MTVSEKKIIEIITGKFEKLGISPEIKKVNKELQKIISEIDSGIRREEVREISKKTILTSVEHLLG